MRSAEIHEGKYVLRINGREVICEVTEIKDGVVHFVWNRTLGQEMIPVRRVMARWEFACEALRELVTGNILDGDG